MPSFSLRWSLKVVPRIALLFTVWGTVLWAAEFNRNMDLIVLKGKQLNAFKDRDAVSLAFYRYQSNTNSWHPIPYQVHEKKDSLDQNFYGVVDGDLDEEDEFIFLSKDVGDQVADDQIWPDNEESKQFPRYELELTDSFSGRKGYIYIFWAPTLKKNSEKYVQFTNGGVTGLTYHIGHNLSRNSGLPDSLFVTSGDNINLLERQQLRIFFNFDTNLSEPMDVIIAEHGKIEYELNAVLGSSAKITFEIKNKSVQVFEGPLYINRIINFSIHYFGSYSLSGGLAKGDFDNERDFSFVYRYCPYHIEAPTNSFNLPLNLSALDNIPILNYEIKALRIIFCAVLNNNGYGMRYFTPRLNTDAEKIAGLKIDGKSDQLIYQSKGYLGTKEWPGKHWWGLVADPKAPKSIVQKATLFNIADLRGKNPLPKGEIPFLDFKDPDDKIVEPKIYGLNGVQMIRDIGLPSTLTIDLSIRQYILPDVLNYNSLLSLFQQDNSALIKKIEMQYNDKIRPGIITDLTIVNRTDNSVKIRWSAVPDDINGELAVRKYLVRFSSEKPHPDSLWKWWDRAKLVDPGPPLAEVGNPIMFTVTNLAKDVQYWFGVIAQDEADNISQTIAMATSVTTPVELSAFAARLRAGVIELQWSTASESNNLGFELQRRYENQSTWQPLTFLEGQGTISSPAQYAWQDRPGKAGTIHYRLKQIDADGQSHLSEAITVAFQAPGAFALLQNYPNPFNPATTIHYEVPERSGQNVELLIYDLLGRKVRTLVSGAAEAGYYRTTWDGLDDRGIPAGAGVYFYVLMSGDTRLTRKMIKVQ